MNIEIKDIHTHIHTYITHHRKLLYVYSYTKFLGFVVV